MTAGSVDPNALRDALRGITRVEMQGADVRATQLIEHSRSERLRKDYPAYDVLCNVYESLKSGGRADEAILARVSGMEFAMRTLINIAESRARHSA